MTVRSYPFLALIPLLFVISSPTKTHAMEWSLQSATTVTLTSNETDTFGTGAGTRLTAIGGFNTRTLAGRADFGFSFDTDSPETSFQVHETYLVWQPLDGFLLLAGRKFRSTGLMDFLSPAEFLSPADLLGFTSGTSRSLHMAADIIEATIYGSSWKLVGSVLPIRPGFPSLNPDSIWFPKEQFPKSIEWLPGFNLSLNQIITSYPENTILAPFPGFQLHGSYANKATEVIAGLYLGPDPEPMYRFRLKLAPENPNLAYDIVVYAERRPILAGFVAAAWTLESIRLYGEASFSPSRYYSAHLDADSLDFDIDGYTLWRTAWAVDTGLGVAAFVQALNMDLIIETRYLYNYPEVHITKPLFSSIGTMYVQRRWMDGRLDTSLLAAMTPDVDKEGHFNGDSGWALSFNLTWRPTMEIEVRLGIPIFGGDKGTDLGRYSMIRQGSLTATLRH